MENEWRDRIINLQNGEATQNDRLDEIEEHLDQLDQLLEGQPTDKKDNGLKGDIHDLGVELNSLRALMVPDQLGHGGIINRLRALEKKAGFEEKKTELHWTFFTAVAVAVISLAGLLLTNWTKIKGLFPEPKPDKLQVMIENAKHPKNRYHHYKVKALPSPDDDQEQ